MSKSLKNCMNWGSLRRRYKCSSTSGKARLFDELCGVSGMNRKYLIRRLNEKWSKPKERPGPKNVYSPAIYAPLLKVFWLGTDQACSKKLKSILADWLPYFEKEQGELSKDVREHLLKMSPATIDRILKSEKIRYPNKRLCGTKPGTVLKNQIPIKTNQWEETKPGFLEADTVAYCGTRLEGNFIWSLTMTDIATTWTENRAIWNKGAEV